MFGTQIKQIFSISPEVVDHDSETQLQVDGNLTLKALNFFMKTLETKGFFLI